jgi:hypothetical protein
MSLMQGATISGSVSDGGANLGLLNLNNTNSQGHALVATTYGPTSTAILGLAYADTGFVHGISGSSTASQGSGVFGHASGSEGKGVIGFGPNGIGVYGLNGSWVAPGSSDSMGVYGRSTASDGTGVMGEANTGTSAKGVYGRSTTGYAGYFAGTVNIVGTLIKSSGSFRIDHPLDPANKYLYHSFVESPDMKNIYDGTVVLDKHGEAVVTLPDWFEALNRDFRYQLTCVGGYAPVYVAEEVHHNAFKIAGGKPGLKVSWQLTGIRHDPWADDHRIPVEEAKPAAEQGTYLYPQGYVQP